MRRDKKQLQEIQQRRRSKRTSQTPKGKWLRKVASGSTMQSFWLGDRKVEFQVVSED